MPEPEPPAVPYEIYFPTNPDPTPDGYELFYPTSTNEKDTTP